MVDPWLPTLTMVFTLFIGVFIHDVYGIEIIPADEEGIPA